MHLEKQPLHRTNVFNCYTPDILLLSHIAYKSVLNALSYYTIHISIFLFYWYEHLVGTSSSDEP